MFELVINLSLLSTYFHTECRTAFFESFDQLSEFFFRASEAVSDILSSDMSTFEKNHNNKKKNKENRYKLVV